MACLLLATPLASPADGYKFTIVAQTGGGATGLAGGGITINEIGQSVSINNNGLVAFLGTAPNGISIFAGDASSLPWEVAGTGSGIEGSAQINDAGQVLDLGMTAVKDTPPVLGYLPDGTVYEITPGYSDAYGLLSLVPASSSPASAGGTALAEYDDRTDEYGNSSIGPLAIGPFSAVDATFSLNDNGDAVFLASTDASSPWLANMAIAGPHLAPIAGGPMWLGAEPMIANTGEVVVKTGPKATDAIVLYNQDLSAEATIADAEMGFTELGGAPGISDNGQYMAFYGEKLSRGSEGIYLAERSGSGFSLQRVTGLDAPDGTSLFSGFAKDMSVSVQGDSQAVRVAFVAIGTGTDAGVYSTGPGVFVSTLHRGPSGHLVARVPEPVAEQGSAIPGIQWKPQGFILSDSVNINTNGVLAFLATSTTGQAVVKATPYPYLTGMDVSDNQGTITWSEVAQTNSFAYLKASEGLGGPGGFNLDANVQAALESGLLVGVYHFARPDEGYSAQAEAVTFLDMANDYIGRGYLPPALDLDWPEVEQYLSQEGHTTQTLSLWVATWLKYVHDRTSRVPVLYTSKSVLGDDLGALASSSYRAWIADVGANTAIGTDPTTDPSYRNGIVVWSRWLFKQYAWPNSAPGIQQGKGALLDSFKGDLTSLLALTAEGSAAPAPGSLSFSGVGGGPLLPPSHGVFTFQVSAPGLSQVDVEWSTDLRNWSDLGTFQATDGKAVCADPNAGASVVRFYRLK